MSSDLKLGQTSLRARLRRERKEREVSGGHLQDSIHSELSGGIDTGCIVGWSDHLS